MEDSEYVTVVSVDNGAENIKTDSHSNSQHTNFELNRESQFVTVLSINDVVNKNTHQAEEVIVYRLPGERLGFGLKFQGGSKSAENIQRLFIQSCATDTPASRAKTSWGNLCEGDEILEIDGIDVKTMTRLECVRYLKESNNLAIKLNVRNIRDMENETKEFIEVKEKSHILPPTPSAPPRKINKRKSLKIDHELKDANTEKPLTPPPDAEYYVNLFSDENENFKFRDYESDDTASTISTVVDNFSIHSNSDLSLSSFNAKQPEISKALKSFTTLEKEFNVDNRIKSDEFVTHIKPPVVFEDDCGNKQTTTKKDIQFHSIEVKRDGRIDDAVRASDYENIDLSSKATKRNYENIEFNRAITQPTPLPRRGITENIKIIIPKVRLIGSDDADGVHECNINTDDSQSKEDDKENELPKLIKCVPKMSLAEKFKLNVSENEKIAAVVKQCIKIDKTSHEICSSSDEDDDVESTNNLMSDDDSDKLGPPEFVDGPGPSEVYFNYHWNNNVLPTIGEVEEEFSSLDLNKGPLVIINKAKDQVTANAESIKINQSIAVPPKQLQMTSTASHRIDKSTGGKPSNTNENVKQKLFAKSEVNVDVRDCDSENNKSPPQQKDKVQSKIASTVVSTTNKQKTNELVEQRSGSQHTESIKNNSKIPIKFNSSNNHKSVITVEKSNKINSNLTSVDHNETLSERNGSTPNIVIVKNVKENLDCRNTERKSEQNKCELIEPPSVSEPKLNCNITSGTVVIAERIILGTESSSSAKPTAIGHQTKMDKINNEIKIGGMDRDNNLTTSKPMIANDIHVPPPTFSRLPPDGHEFPPNFSEPIIITSVFKQNGDIKLGGERSSLSDVAPSPPKSNPPQTLPRKIYRQDLVITVDDARFDQAPNFIPIATPKNVCTNIGEEKPTPKIAAVLQTSAPSIVRKSVTETSKTKSQQNDDALVRTSTTPRKQYGTKTPSNWRKDEKSEKSVRDKIAMFSNDKIQPADRKILNKSTENLLLDNGDRSQRKYEVEGSTLTKKAQSVDTLDTIDCSSENQFQRNIIESICDNNSSSKKYESLPSNVYSYHLRAYSVENLRDVDSTSLKQTPLAAPTNRTTINNSQTPIIPTSYASLSRSKPPTITRTTSFSGSREHQNYDERRRTSISNLLEQRKKSMSKLRGLIIPEKSALSDEAEQIVDLPEIKSADTQKVPLIHSTQHSYSRREPVVPNPRHYTSSYQSLSSSQDGNGYVSIFGSGTNRTVPRNGRSSETKTIFPKPAAVVTPPTKPPRTSLIIASQQTTKENNKFDDSDSDSVFCAKISSPPHSPVTNPPREKMSLTRTLSSETNTSIASSTTTTLTSGSGSQASCSSAGSTPTIDMSRKIVRSTSKESYVNRKSILALSKCRSGKDDSNGRQHQRYEDEDSTDGCEDDVVRHIPKSKQRSIHNIHNKGIAESAEITNYRLASNENAVVDMIVKVAEFVEITSDSNSDSNTCDSSSPAKAIDKFMDEERKASFKAAVQEAKIVKTVPKVNVPTFQNKQPESNNDLAKWVRSEVAKTRKVEETQKALIAKTKPPEQPKASTRNSVLENIKKFNSSVDKPVSTPAPLNITKKAPNTDIRKSSENKLPAPLKSPKQKFNTHDRFSSLDSLASSSSGVSSTQTLLTNTPEHGSYSSFESNHSLITPADLQLIIEEADPPLKTPEAIVIVLYRESPECSVGVTLAGGADYETKEITIHCILANSPAYKDGRLRKGDRILSINGLSMRGLTHRESVTVLKSPRTEVVMVITRSESVKISHDLGSSMGSLNSLCDKPYSQLDGNRRRTFHKASKSLDLDVDGVSNEGSVFDDCKSLDDGESTASASFYGVHTKSNGNHNEDAAKIVEVMKDSCGLGLAIEGGLDSPTGHKPLTAKKVFMGGAAEKAGNINVGDVILSINDFCTKDITRVQAWNYMKGLPSGPVKFVLR